MSSVQVLAQYEIRLFLDYDVGIPEVTEYTGVVLVVEVADTIIVLNGTDGSASEYECYLQSLIP